MDRIEPDGGLLMWSTVIVCSFILLIIALVSINKKPFSSTEKLGWLLLVLFVPTFGALIYFISAHSKQQDKTPVI